MVYFLLRLVYNEAKAKITYDGKVFYTKVINVHICVIEEAN